jgi:ribosomal protein L11 methyltransferase
MRWTRIQVNCKAAATDAVAAALIDAGCGGTEHSPDGVAGYLPVDDTLEGRLDSLRSLLDGIAPEIQPSSPEIVLTFVEEEDWAEAWKAHFHPIPIGERLVVAPSWSEYAPAEGQVVVWLDPGMAFGTGSHPTTQLCLEALEGSVRRGMAVLDWGTGSGILAIAAAKLGAARVIAGDVDPLAVQIARENARINEAEEKIDYLVGETPSFEGWSPDLIVCNILAGVILDLSEPLSSLLRPGGRLIASGIIDSRGAEVAAGLERAGFRIDEIRSSGEWVALLAEKTESVSG